MTIQRNKNLILIILTDEAQKSKHGGYTYLIKGDGNFGHAAFKTRQGMKNFLKVTGLKIGKRMYWPGCYRLEGEYLRCFTMNKLAFDLARQSNKTVNTITLSNGQYTDAVYFPAPRNVLLYLNVNADRVVHDYAVCREIYG